MEQDKPTLVPAVLSDLVDVDGTPAAGDTLTFDGTVWGVSTPTSPFRWKTVNVATEVGHANSFTYPAVGPDTDVSDVAPPQTSDVIIATGTYQPVNVCVIQRAGNYSVDLALGVAANPTDDGTRSSVVAYMVLNDENYGPGYLYAVKAWTLGGATAEARVMGGTTSFVVWLNEGDELSPSIRYSAGNDASNINAWGGITRIR